MSQFEPRCPVGAEPSAQSGRPDYQPPRLIRLGGWQAVTLVNSLPGGPGASVFSSSKPGFWKDLGL